MSRPERDLRALGAHIAREEDTLLARHPGPNLLRGARRSPRREPAVWFAAACVAVSVAAAIALFLSRARPLDVTVAGAQGVGDGWISAPPDGEVPIRFSDGTEMALQPDAHARVLEVTPKGAHLMLESGRARVSVRPARGGRWAFTAGPYTVEVKGTRFDLAWSPREQVFSLALVEGNVVVSGCGVGEGRPLFAGETLRASCLDKAFRIDRASTLAPPAATSADAIAARADSPPVSMPERDDSTAPTASSHAPRTAASSGDSWRDLGRASHFKEAWARVNELGFETELARAGRDDLLLLGDVARLSGDSDRAIAAYDRVRKRAPGTEAAANAAFSMGRVYFDQREAYAEAARWFATYRDERRNGPLARDAMGRQMEALSRAGDRASAARVADEYLLRYPQGPHAPLARSLRPRAN